MNSTQFKLIEDSWTAVLNETKNNLDSILTTDDLLNISITKLKELISFCHDLQIKMDSLFCDYRHIIGMGDCTIIQTNRLTKILHDVEQYRGDMKRIASITDLNIVRLIPSKSTYKLKLTPEIKLENKLRPGQTEFAEIDDSTIVQAAEPIVVETAAVEVQHENDDNIFKPDCGIVNVDGHGFIAKIAKKETISKILFDYDVGPCNGIKAAISLNQRTNGIQYSAVDKDTFKVTPKTDRSRKAIKQLLLEYLK